MKKGLTLLEILITFAIASIIVVSFANFIFNTFKTYDRGEDTTRLQNDSLAASSLIEKELRATTAVINAQANTLTIQAYAVSSSAPPDQIRYYIENNQLKRGLIPPTGSPPNYTYNPASETIKIITANVVSNPLFEYFDQNGAQLSQPVLAASVTLVKFNLTLDTDITKPPDAVATSLKIQLRNRKMNN